MARPYYSTKAAWATARAAEIRRQADLLPYAHAHDWRAVKRRTSARSNYQREALRYERMAERFRARGE